MIESSDAAAPKHAQSALLFGTLVIAVCGLVYELLAGTISSYLLGDSVYQFSIVIGVFMAAMGFGAYITRFIHGDLAGAFVTIQVLLGVIGGLSAPWLFFAFASQANYDVALFSVLIGAGTLVGIEIPLIVRLLKEQATLRVNLSNVLTLDYAGALLAALAFPLVLVPQLGLVRTSLLFGLANVLVGGLALYTLWPWVRKKRLLGGMTGVLAVGLASGLFVAERFERFIDSKIHSGNIIYSHTSAYQRIVLTENGGIINLLLNGGLQFSSIDEHRYHEALVVPAMGLAERRSNILILGGGDGLALQRVLGYDEVKRVTLVDLDPAVTDLFTRNERLAALNDRAFHDPRVTVKNEDAGKFFETANDVFDVIIIDLPDPRDIHLSRLYTKGFYTVAARHLAAGGILVTQATSPQFAREAYWSIVETLEATGSPYREGQRLYSAPYHAYVPTFGDWGFVMASPRHIDTARLVVPDGFKFLSQSMVPSLFSFAPDTARVDVDVNTSQSHVLAQYYQEGWSRWYR